MKLGLIGEGIGQSQSPDLHRRLGTLADLPTSYELFDARGQSDFDFFAQVRQLKEQGYRGCNVTYPFKQRALDLADSIGEGARKVGSSNTLIFEADGIRAENTDYTGFVRAYQQTFPDRPAGEVLMIGAGGVGRAVACALGELGITRLNLLDLDFERAQALCEELIQLGIPAQAVSQDDIPSLLPSCQGLVNCSPVGHIHHPGCPVARELLHDGLWLFDAVYVPARTELIQAAENLGLPVLTGVDLFVYQGLNAYRFFADSEQVDHVLDDNAQAIREYYFERLLGTAE